MWSELINICVPLRWFWTHRPCGKTQWICAGATGLEVLLPTSGELPKTRSSDWGEGHRGQFRDPIWRGKGCLSSPGKIPPPILWSIFEEDSIKIWGKEVPSVNVICSANLVCISQNAMKPFVEQTSGFYCRVEREMASLSSVAGEK